MQRRHVALNKQGPDGIRCHRAFVIYVSIEETREKVVGFLVNQGVNRLIVLCVTIELL